MLSLRERKGRCISCRGEVRIGNKKIVVKEHSTGLTDRKAAEVSKARLMARLQDELIYGRQSATVSVTFADAALTYVNRPGGLGRGDLDRIKKLNEFLGDVVLTEIVPAWQRYLEEKCAGRMPATAERTRSTLQAAINHYGRAYDVDVPRIRGMRVQNTRVRFLTQAEAGLLHEEYADHVQPIITVLRYQSCRTQEALQLQWQHVDFKHNTLFFARTKNGEPRTVKMHKKVARAIKSIWKAREKPISGHVFLNTRGKPYADTRDYKLPGGNPLKNPHKTACKRAGINDFRMHDWRHHWASWCVKSGIDLETIKRMGGWKSLRMLERYAAIDDTHMQKAIDKLE